MRSGRRLDRGLRRALFDRCSDSADGYCCNTSTGGVRDANRSQNTDVTESKRRETGEGTTAARTVA